MKERILSVLKNSSGYISGEMLSRELGVSRTAVWKNIKILRNEGYVIDSVTNKGYMLISLPDKLSSAIIRENLGTLSVGTEIIILDSVDSTNDELKRLTAKNAESGLIIAAEQQTKGKGRLTRSWSSGNGGIYFSLLLRPDLPPTDIAGITLAAGYGVCLAIREYTGLDAKIKWPNDVIIGRKKVCGILTEMAAQTDRVDYVVIGIGINVNTETFPDEISSKASSLFIESGKKIDRNDFFRCVIKKLDTVITSFMASFSAEDMSDFRNLCATIGREVSVERNNHTISGIAEDVTDSGELVILDNSGNKFTINSGEVIVQGIY